jgi:hypothetical protein
MCDRVAANRGNAGVIPVPCQDFTSAYNWGIVTRSVSFEVALFCWISSGDTVFAG